MSYVKNFTIATSGIGSTRSNVIMGDIPTLEQYTSHVPTIRVASFGCAGDETLAMSIWTIIRYALDRYSDIRVYPTYFDIDDTQTLITKGDGLRYFPEIKNNANLIGQLKESDGLTLEIAMSGIMVKQAPQVQTLKVADLAELLQQLPTIIQELVALLAERTTENQVLRLSVKLSSVEYFKHLWGLEKALLSSLISEDWNEEEFIRAIEEVIAQGASVESDLVVETVFDIARSAIFPPYNLTVEGRKRLLDAIMGSHNEVAVASLIESLNQHGAAQAAIHLIERSETEFKYVVKSCYAESLLLNGSIKEAIQVYQDILRDNLQNRDVLATYAATLVHASKLEKLPDDFAPVIVREGEINDEILFAYQEAYKIEGEVEHLLSAFEYAIEYQDNRSLENFNALASVDKTGVYVASAIATLQEDELVEVIDYMEQQGGDDANIIRLLALAELYLAIDDSDAAKECLNEYLSAEGAQGGRTRLLQLHLLSPLLEFQVSQFHQMNAQKMMLSESEIDTIEEGLALNPHFTDGYLVLAEAYANRSDYEAGIEVLQDASEIIQDDPRLFLTLGQLMWANGEHDEALNTWLAGNKQFPYDITLIVWIARSLFDDGAEDEAKLYLQQAEMISPTSRDLATVRGYIGRKLSED